MVGFFIREEVPKSSDPLGNRLTLIGVTNVTDRLANMRVTRSIMLIIFLHIAIMKRKFYFTRKLILLDTIKAISDSNVMISFADYIR